MKGIRKRVQRWNFLVYFMVVCFLSSVVGVQPAFAAKKKVKLVYDLLDDNIDYKWIKGEEKIVYELQTKIDKKVKDYWLVAVKEVKKKVLAKVKKKFQKDLKRHNKNFLKEAKEINESKLSEKKKEKKTKALMKAYVAQVRDELKVIKSDNDDEVLKIIEKELMSFLKVKDRKHWEKYKKRGGLALELTAVGIGLGALTIGTVAAVIATVTTTGTAAIVIGAVATATAAIAGLTAGLIKLYRTVAKHMRSTMDSLENTKDAFDDFKKVAKREKAIKSHFNLKNPAVKAWRKDVIKAHAALNKTLGNFSKNITRTAKYYTKMDKEVEKVAVKIRKIKKGGNKKEEAKRKKLLKLANELDKVTDEDLDDLRAMVKLYGDIQSELRKISKKLKGPELRDTVRDAVQSVDRLLGKFDRYGQPILDGLSDVAGTVSDLHEEVSSD